jgi:hypothetical protein
MTDYREIFTAGISDADYHADTTSLSSTGARKILECPARFRWERDNPPEPKPAFDFGHLVHRLVLGEGSVIQIVEATDWRGKAAQAERDAARAAGAVPALRSEYDAAVAMREAVMAHPTAAALFAEGVAELSGYWQDEPTDIGLRFRPDWLTTLDGRPICVDLKTTINADPAEFARSVVKWGYMSQADWYLQGLAAHAINDAAFYFVCIEKTAPYPVSVIELDTDALAEGAHRNRRAIDLFDHCSRTGIWPAYGTGIHTVSLPPWATRGSLQTDADQLITELAGL